VARSLYEAAPHRAAATHLPDGSFALLVAGWNLADATDFAHALRQRVLAAMPGAAAATRVCVGVDALPARAPAAWMLQQRASQALARVRRDPADGGVGVFASSNPRGASGANASSSGTGADPS
jgi:GGDEF domain-containing protein